VLPTPVAQLLLVLACAALLDAGWRAAAQLTRDLLARGVAAATFAAAAAALSALGLGLVGLGTEPGWLVAVAALVWLAARFALPDPEPSLSEQLRAAWDGSPSLARIALGAAGGALLVWALWIMRRPDFGFDGAHYHLPEAFTWLRDGHPGSVEDVFPGFPVGAYPLVNEVLVSWAAGISRSQAPALLWTPALIALTAMAGWLGLRTLEVRRLPAALALAALCLVPVVTYQLNAVTTDVPCLAWTVATGGLAVAAVRGREPGLALPMLVAGGLAAGTKTTALPIVLAVSLFALWSVRARLRGLAPALAGAVVVAALLGGAWYVRNLVRHGSPLWPFLSLPGSDPVPQFIHDFGTRFVERPLGTTREFGRAWATHYFGGGLIVAAAALASPLVARTRAVRVGALATAACIVLWTLAPVTGLPEDPGIRNTLYVALNLSPRYFLPGLAVATLTVCLANRDASGRWPRALTTVLGLAAVVNLAETFRLPVVDRPPPLWVAAATGLGAGAAWLARGRGGSAIRPALAGIALVALAAALSLASHGLVDRYAGPREDGGLIRYIEAHGGDRTLHMTPTVLSVLWGERLDRRVEAIPHGTSCAQVRRFAREGLVIVRTYKNGGAILSTSEVDACVGGLKLEYADLTNSVFSAP
jgi:hypothetical protein